MDNWKTNLTVALPPCVGVVAGVLKRIHLGGENLFGDAFITFGIGAVVLALYMLSLALLVKRAHNAKPGGFTQIASDKVWSVGHAFLPVLPSVITFVVAFAVSGRLSGV